MDSTRDAVQIVVVDDDECVLRLVSAVLKKEGYRVHLASDGQQAVEACAKYGPDLLILDLSLPDVSGLDVLRDLRSWCQCPVLVLSGYGEEKVIVEALDLGADDYLTKPFRPRELLARIRSRLRLAVGAAVATSRMDAGEISVDFARRRVLRQGEEVRLTRTEFDILALLMQNAERVMAAEIILEEVWGPHHGDYAQTLRVHVGHLRKKIETDPSAPRYIHTEPGVGYCFADSSAVNGNPTD